MSLMGQCHNEHAIKIRHVFCFLGHVFRKQCPTCCQAHQWERYGRFVGWSVWSRRLDLVRLERIRETFQLSTLLLSQRKMWGMVDVVELCCLIWVSEGQCNITRGRLLQILLFICLIEYRITISPYGDTPVKFMGCCSMNDYWKLNSGLCFTDVKN